MHPEIAIQKGLTIGYPARRFHGGATEVRLAEAKAEIRLPSGRHLLLARNGRGKTTLLKTLSGLIPPIGGAFGVTGQVQYIDEELRFDPELNSKQIFAAFFRNGLLERALGYAGRLELDVKKPYGKLSKGNRQKVTLILAETRATDGKSQVLFLDEPFSGLDFHVRDEVDAIWNENRENIVRLVCVHPDEPTLKAESAVLISDGEIRQLEVEGALDWFETRESLN
ncbi:MAG: ATP-binding cassette domain-containing protein [Akkermansiaceae bacterium]|nr:ATP-binding cassette domain-containing protein [Akkermansiaceae bacterium]MCP5550778.1 ATP-binding cassette domain-containing protein [Akkermansiaceae bacterium]